MDILDGDGSFFIGVSADLGAKNVVLDGNVLGARSELWSASELNASCVVFKDSAANVRCTEGNGKTKLFQFIEEGDNR